jgi:hypothetical protein
MVADSQVQSDNRYDLYGDNDNGKGAVLSRQEIHPLAREGAKRLIAQHSQKTPVVIKSWGSPEVVYKEIRQSLIDFGYQIGMAEDMAQKLVDQAEDHSEAARSKYGANIIALKLEVSRAQPSAQFETGAMEVQRIDGLTNHAQVAGATSVAVGINTGGTTTTALRDSVAEIMQAMSGSSVAVWIHFEAPNKSELEGIANEAVMAAVAEIAGGGLAPEKAEIMMEQIEALVEAGLVAPEVLNVVQNLQQIQIVAMEGNKADIPALAQDIMEDLAQIMENDSASPEMMAALIETFDSIVETYDLGADIDLNAFVSLKQDFQVSQVVDKLEVIAADLDGADKEKIEALIEDFDGLEGVELLSHLDTVETQLTDMGIDAAALADVKADIAGLKDMVIQTLPLEQKMEVLAEMSAPDLMEVLQELKGAETLPPEIAELIEQLDIDNLSVEDLKEALANQGPAADTVQKLVMALASPDVQAALPPAVQAAATRFVIQNPQMIESVVTNAVVSEMKAAASGIDAPAIDSIISTIDTASLQTPEIAQIVEKLQAGEPITPAEATALQAVAENTSAQEIMQANTATVEARDVTKAIERLEAGESVANIEPKILEQVAEKMGDATPPQVSEALAVPKLETATVENLQAMLHSEVLPAETKEAIQTYLNEPTSPSALKDVKQALGDMAPPQIINAFTKPLPPAALASQLQAIETAMRSQQAQSLSAAEKKPYEALRAAVKTLQDIPAGQKISPAKAEVLLRKIDEGREIVKDPAINRQIDKIREQVMDRTQGGREKVPEDVRAGKCPGCGGGNCATCGGDQRAAAKGTSDMKEERGLSDLIPVREANDNGPVEHPTFSEASVLKDIVSDLKGDDVKPHLKAEDKKPIEALNSAIRTIETINLADGETISAYQAEVLLRKIDEGMTVVKDLVQVAQVEQLREQIMDHTQGGPESIPEEVRHGKCPGCGGGNCATCGGDQRAAAKGTSDMKEERSLMNLIQPKATAA